MDGLIKGMVDWALDGRDAPDNQGSDEQRSRSTWAQVVSGDQDNDDESRTKTNTVSARRPIRNEGYGRSEEWESSGSRPSMKPQRQTSNVQEQDEDDDGWQTVGKKPSKRAHKVHRDRWKEYKCAPSDQQYSEEVNGGVQLEPSEEELSDLAKAANKLWELDLNRLVPGKDYEIDCGEGKKVHQREDMAEGSLFSWLSDDIFRRPTYSRFCSLLDNYNPHQGHKEQVTAEERDEQTAFIEEISRTAPIKYLYNYLATKGIASTGYQEFKRMLTSLWFDLYSRGGTSSCSSAFEHVFVGEIKDGEQEVSGFHNWLQFYLEEAKGRVDYQGYIFPRRRGHTPDDETQLLTIQFEWNGVLKSVSSTLIGVSPEFEIALYTLFFYQGGEDNHVEIGPYPVNIKCYRHGNRLGSAFPVADC